MCLKISNVKFVLIGDGTDSLESLAKKNGVYNSYSFGRSERDHRTFVADRYLLFTLIMGGITACYPEAMAA